MHIFKKNINKVTPPPIEDAICPTDKELPECSLINDIRLLHMESNLLKEKLPKKLNNYDIAQLVHKQSEFHHYRWERELSSTLDTLSQKQKQVLIDLLTEQLKQESDQEVIIERIKKIQNDISQKKTILGIE